MGQMFGHPDVRGMLVIVHGAILCVSLLLIEGAGLDLSVEMDGAAAGRQNGIFGRFQNDAAQMPATVVLSHRPKI